MVLGCSATTELSSLTASSTTSLFGAFLRSRIAVEKSFFSAGALQGYLRVRQIYTQGESYRSRSGRGAYEVLASAMLKCRLERAGTDER